MSNPLYEAMICRASDIAHYMLRHDMPITIASGPAKNGHPVTVIIAIGEEADIAEQVGARLMQEIQEKLNLRADRARRN